MFLLKVSNSTKKIISVITRKYFFYVDISHLKDVSYLDCIKELFCMIKMKQEGLAWDWKMCKDDGNDK